MVAPKIYDYFSGSQTSGGVLFTPATSSGTTTALLQLADFSQPSPKVGVNQPAEIKLLGGINSEIHLRQFHFTTLSRGLLGRLGLSGAVSLLLSVGSVGTESFP